MSILDSLRAERTKYGTVMNDDECVNLVNSVAWQYRHEGWGLTGKNFGAGVGRRYDDTQCGHDTLLNNVSQDIYDVLRGAGAESEPVWNYLGKHTQWSTRPFVPAIEARDPQAPVVLKTKIGATLFCLADLYANERGRLDETLYHLREDLGASFLRVFWRKGTGAPGDYWLNDGYYSCVRSGVDSIPLIRDAVAYARSAGFTFAHCVFADNLGMPLSTQDRYIDVFSDAVRGLMDATEYIEVFNEPYTRGGGHGGDIATLHRHGQRLRERLGNDFLLSLGTPQAVHMGDDAALEAEVRDMYGVFPAANLITVHFSRGSNNPQQAPNLPAFAPQERSNGEPIGPDSSVAQTKDPLALVNNYRETNRKGYRWYVYHDDFLIRPRGGNCFNRPEWPNIATALRTAAGISGGGGGQPQPQPQPEPPTDPAALASGQELQPLRRLRSLDGRFTAEFQHDANFVVYDWRSGVPVAGWNSSTFGEPQAVAMQGDGHLVLYRQDRAPHSIFWGPAGSILEMQNDGNLVMYHDGHAVWSAGAQ